MDTLKDVKKQINSLGIRRCKFDPFVFDTALNWFIEISNEMLKRKDEKFDYDNVKDVIDFIINWTYLTANTTESTLTINPEISVNVRKKLTCLKFFLNIF